MEYEINTGGAASLLPMWKLKSHDDIYGTRTLKGIGFLMASWAAVPWTTCIWVHCYMMTESPLLLKELGLWYSQANTMLSDAHSKSIRESLSPTEHYAHARFCLDVLLEVWQNSPQVGACFIEHRLELSGVPVLLVGRQSTESWSKGLSSFQTIWDRGSVSEWTLDSMWPSICIAWIQMWPFESEKGTGGLVLSVFLPWGRTTLKP